MLVLKNTVINYLGNSYMCLHGKAHSLMTEEEASSLCLFSYAIPKDRPHVEH